MRETRTAQFKGIEYRYVFLDEEEVKGLPGVDRLAGVASHPEGASHATWGTFVDEAEVRDRHWHVLPGDVVLDIGPAFGSYTITAAIQGARVYAFEPCEFCRSILAINLAANPEAAKLVTVVAAGVHGNVGWFEPNEGKIYTEPGGERLLVKPLDSLARVAVGRITAIKLDVEGAELGALQSGEETIREHRPRILVEEHEFKEKGIGAACEAVLRGYGYTTPPVRINHGAVEHSFYQHP